MDLKQFRSELGRTNFLSANTNVIEEQLAKVFYKIATLKNFAKST